MVVVGGRYTKTRCFTTGVYAVLLQYCDKFFNNAQVKDIVLDPGLTFWRTVPDFMNAHKQAASVYTVLRGKQQSV